MIDDPRVEAVMEGIGLCLTPVDCCTMLMACCLGTLALNVAILRVVMRERRGR